MCAQEPLCTEYGATGTVSSSMGCTVHTQQTMVRERHRSATGTLILRVKLRWICAASPSMKLRGWKAQDPIGNCVLGLLVAGGSQGELPRKYEASTRLALGSRAELGALLADFSSSGVPLQL